MNNLRKIFIIIFFCISVINLYAKNGLALSTVSETNKYPYMKGRQMININFSSGWAGFLTASLNAITYDYEVTTNFAKLNLNLLIPNISKYIHNMDFKGSMWYIPNIAYTFLYRENLGFEFGIGVQSMTFGLSIYSDKFSGIVKQDANFSSINGDSTFKATYTYIPITFGVKLFSGKSRRTINTFRIGFEPIVYSLRTKNALTGDTINKTYNNFSMYISYELGWSIELFPTREWPVKPYIDISLLEIGYYIKSSAHILYRDTRDAFLSFGAGMDLVDLQIPSLSEAPYLKYVFGIRFILFPRIGFSMRF